MAMVAGSAVIASNLTPQTSTTTVPFNDANQWLGAGYTNGNMTSLVDQTMAYDAEQRLRQWTMSGPPAISVTYAYDGDGRRTQKVSGTASSEYVYDAQGNLAAEYGGPVSPVRGTLYITRDHLGSTRLVTNALGDVVGCHDYLPFGEEVPQSWGRSGLSCYSQTTETLDKFTGKVRDGESGLDYFGARYMSSAQGRFTSPDPIHIMPQKLLDPQQWNMYSYVRNNPLRFLDPTGMYVAGCDGDIKNCDKQIANFDKALRSALKSKDQSVRDGASAYGTLGDKNGVNVNFTNVVDPKNDNVVGQVTSQAGTSGFTYDEKTNTFQQATQVSIKAGLSGSDLQETAVHEGVHVEDRASFINSFSQGLALDFSFHANYSLNITGRQSEVNAYSVENTLRKSLGDPARNIRDILSHPPYSANPGMNRPILPGIVPANPQ